MIKNIDPIWEKKYSEGYKQLYPWDTVVSFVFKNIPHNCLHSNIRILELGFGTGPNLWFAAREGFRVFGIEASNAAVHFAKNRFKEDSLEGDLQQGDFTQLPFNNEYFDLVIDRCSLACVDNIAQNKTFSEILRVLKKGGRFLHNTYSDNHSSFKASQKTNDGLNKNITSGTLTGVGNINFLSEAQISKKFGKEWKLLQVQKKEFTDLLNNSKNIHSEWAIIAEKI